MLGLTAEKLFVVALLAALIVGPHRLPEYASRLGELIRGVRDVLRTARERAETETGMSADDWKRMDPRQYDPRRIVREALAEGDAARPPDADAAAVDDAARSADPGAGELPGVQPRPTRWVIAGGSSGHPRRVAVPDEGEHSEPVAR